MSTITYFLHHSIVIEIESLDLTQNSVFVNVPEVLQHVLFLSRLKIDRKSDWAKWARFSEAILYILWFWQVLVWQITAYDNQWQIYIRRNNLKIEPMRMGFAQFWVNNNSRPIFGRLRDHWTDTLFFRES